MQSYTTIIGVVELRLQKQSYTTVQKRYSIGSSTVTLIEEDGTCKSGEGILSARKSPPSRYSSP